MKILWVKSDFLHPTTRGGQIRTLEMLRRLHARHEVHYVAFDDPNDPEGLRRSGEYSAKAYPIRHSAPPRRSLRFAGQLVRGLYSELPVSIDRYRSSEMQRVVGDLVANGRFDAIVCDFLTPAVNFPDLRRAVLFQHNVETLIWERHAATAQNPLARMYLRRQASRMKAFEASVCRSVSHVVAVSGADAQLMREWFCTTKVSPVPTGVDLEYFSPPVEPAPRTSDLVFVGSMDWLPNIDGMQFFIKDVLPLIRQSKPECTVAIVGRKPGPEIQALAQQDPHIVVTGTVPDVRPFLWGAKVSIVPLRIGGGTRLKIYEAMAARTPVVSTAVGAEGLDVKPGDEIRIADTPQLFADQCLRLLNSEAERRVVAENAWQTVSSRFSWEAVNRQFEDVLTACA